MDNSKEKKRIYYENLNKETAIMAYLDLSNMFHWQEVLGWRFRTEDVVKQILKLPSIKEVKVYYGLNEKDKEASYGFHKRIMKTGAILRSKPVKFIKKNIDEALLFKKSTRSLFNGGINSKMCDLINELKKTGTIVEEAKCNFDVEMTMDIMDDVEKMSAVLLFSGDSDLAAPLERLKLKGKRIYVVGVRGMTAGELQKVKDLYIDFGKFYDGEKRYPESENPAFGGTA